MPNAATVRQAAPAARTHYHDIDGARSVLMFLSVALHAGTVYAPQRSWITSNVDRHEFFDWLIFGLHLFITPTFFFVGGFFTVLLLSRRAVGDFFWNRFLRTAVPLITIALSFNMLELYLRYHDAGGSAGILGWLSTDNFAEVWSSGLWQLHLWFLVSLIPMFVISGLIHGAMPRNARLRRWGKAISDAAGQVVDSPNTGRFAIVLLLLGLINFANYAAAAQVPQPYALLAPGFQSWYKLMSELPFFIVGIMAALSPGLLRGLVRWRWWMPYAAIAAFVLQPYGYPTHSFMDGAFLLFANQLAVWTLVLFLLQFFHRFANYRSQKMSWLADCALSMYLFHHCFVYIFGQMFTQVDWPIFAEFLAVTVLSAGVVIVIHEFGVRRFSALRLLFNGKTDIQDVRRQPDLLQTFVPARS